MPREAVPGDQIISRRHFVIGATLCAASAVAYSRQPQIARPRIKEASFDHWVPTNFELWKLEGSSGVVLPPPDSLSARLYDDLVTRVYGRAGSDVMMLLAYNNAQDGVLQVHRPEVCYPAGGFSLTDTEGVSIPILGTSVPCNLFTAATADRTEQVVYFTRLGRAFPRSWSEQRIAVIQANLAGKIPDGLLLRVSVLNPNRDEAFVQLREFLGAFAAAAHPSLQNLLIA